MPFEVKWLVAQAKMPKSVPNRDALKLAFDVSFAGKSKFKQNCFTEIFLDCYFFSATKTLFWLCLCLTTTDKIQYFFLDNRHLYNGNHHREDISRN